MKHYCSFENCTNAVLCLYAEAISYHPCPQWPCASKHPACGQFPPDIVLPAVALYFFPRPRASPAQAAPHMGGPAAGSPTTHGRSRPRATRSVCFITESPILHQPLTLHVISENVENKKWWVCCVCSSSYLVCQTCKKYGKTGHLNDTEKQWGAHNNSGFVSDEKKDPRDKLWWQSSDYFYQCIMSEW